MAEIRSAKYDHTHCNSQYAQEQCKLVDEKFRPLIDAADESSRAELEKQYKAELRLARNDRIMNKTRE
mgnify:FL=1